MHAPSVVLARAMMRREGASQDEECRRRNNLAAGSRTTPSMHELANLDMYPYYLKRSHPVFSIFFYRTQSLAAMYSTICFKAVPLPTASRLAALNNGTASLFSSPRWGMTTVLRAPT